MNDETNVGEVTRILEELMERWETGETVSVEDYCRDTPHLIEPVRSEWEALKKVNHLLSDSNDRQGSGQPSAKSGAANSNCRYRIQEFHAKGGVSEVYLALDEKLGRKVALKYLKSTTQNDPSFRERLKREAELTSQLDHPGIVSILSVGNDDEDSPFYAMQFVEGKSYQEEIVSFHQSSQDYHSTEFRRLLNHFVDVCQTIAYAHDKGVIHRDIKPSNIVTGNFGETFLIDWGLAKRIGETDSAPLNQTYGSAEDSNELTQIGNIIGTPSYLSPEQATGKAASEPSDIFNLGATLFCLLNGGPPYQSNSLIEIIEKAKTARFDMPRTTSASIPKPLISIWTKAMQLEPSSRYLSATELANDIESFLAGKVTTAYQESWLERSARWIKRNRTLVTTGLVTSIVAAVILAVSTILLMDSNKNLAEREADAKRNFEAAQKSLYSQQIALAQSEIEKSNLKRAREILDQCEIRFRSWEWKLLDWQIDRDRPTISLSSGRSNSKSLAFSHDGLWLLTGNTQGELLAYRRETENDEFKLIDSFETEVDIVALAIDRTDQRVAIVGQGLNQRKGVVEIWSLQEGVRLASRPCHKSLAQTVCWSNSGDQLATGGSGGDIRVRDPSDLQPILRINDAHFNEVRKLVFGGEDTYLISVGDDGKIKKWDMGGEQLDSRLAHRGGIDDLISDGTYVYSVGANSLACRWSLEDGLPLDSQFVGHRDRVTSLDLCSTNSRLVTGSLDRNIRIWSTENGNLLKTITHHSSHIRCVQWSPSGDLLASVADEGGVNVWRVDDIAGRGPIGNMVSFSPVSNQLLVAGRDSLASWKTDTELLNHRQTISDDMILAVAHMNHSSSYAICLRSGEVRIFDPDDPGESSSFVCEGSKAVRAAFSKNDGRLFVAYDNGEVRAFKSGPMQEYAKLALGVEPSGLAVTHDGKYLVITQYNGKMTVLHLESFEEIMKVQTHPQHTLALAVHPKKNWAATTGKSGEVKIWDLESGKSIQQFQVGASWLNCLAFTPDGSRLITGSEYTLFFWDVENEQEVLSKSVEKCVHSISFSRDGTQMAIGGEDPRIRIWKFGK